MDTDKTFSGYIPKLYESYMVPMLFEPYAADIAARVAKRSPKRVLEIAAGTGVATRALASTLPRETVIVATDLNQPMIDEAAALGTARRVEWRQADAMELPFEEGTFDAVVCQFGVMFLPDKAKGFGEARRALRPGGMLIFNAWDRIEENEFAHTVMMALAGLFPDDPARFMTRVPHGYFDLATIRRDLASGGFTAAPEMVTLAKRSRARSPRDVAIAICQGTPVRNEIEARDASRLDEATDVAAEAIGRRFGFGEVDGKMQAHVVAIER